MTEAERWQNFYELQVELGEEEPDPQPDPFYDRDDAWMREEIEFKHNLNTLRFEKRSRDKKAG